MTWLMQYRDLVSMQLRSMRSEILFSRWSKSCFPSGWSSGSASSSGCLEDDGACTLVTGTATQSFVTVGLGDAAADAGAGKRRGPDRVTS